MNLLYFIFLIILTVNSTLEVYFSQLLLYFWNKHVLGGFNLRHEPSLEIFDGQICEPHQKPRQEPQTFCCMILNLEKVYMWSNFDALNSHTNKMG